MRRSTLLVSMGALLLATTAVAGAAERWGVHIQVYGEPHETGRPIYVNVLPLVYETDVGAHATLKIGSLVGLRIAEAVSVGNVGLSVGAPFYPFSDADTLSGFFAGPIVTTSYNFATSEVVVSAAADVGYSFAIGTPASMTLGGELGVSAFFVDGTSAFRPHFGPAVYLFFGPSPAGG